VVVLCEVAIEVILVGRSSYHVLKAFVGVSQIGHVGQAVRAGGIPVGVGQVVYDIKTEVWHLPSAVVSFEIAVEVVVQSHAEHIRELVAGLDRANDWVVYLGQPAADVIA